MQIIQNEYYKRIGILVRISLVQGGPGYPFFSLSVYEYIIGKDCSLISPGVEEILDFEVKSTVEKV